MRKLILILMAVALAAPSMAQTELFAGTAINASGTSNDIFTIDVATDIATSVIAGRAVWGATYDTANAVVLFTSDGGAVGGADLYSWDPAVGGAPTLLGTITDVTGTPFRIDGLAISGGVLYGSRAAAAADGLYTINMGTLVATIDFAFANSISGIDADPATGIIYGVDDTNLQLVSIDPVADTITNVAAYPDPAETDIDGIGVGGGKAYLIPDDNAPGLIYVYDIATGVFETPLTAPWGATADTFSGGAVILAPQVPFDPNEIPTLSEIGIGLLALLLASAAVVFIRRRA